MRGSSDSLYQDDKGSNYIFTFSKNQCLESHTTYPQYKNHYRWNIYLIEQFGREEKIESNDH